MNTQDLPGWLRLALSRPEWVAQQRVAWERWNSREMFGRPAPQFLEITEENLGQLPDQLARHFERAEQRLREARLALEKVSKEYLYPCCSAEKAPPEQ